MTPGALRAPGPKERFRVRTLSHEEVDHWFHVYRPVVRRGVERLGPLSFNQGFGASRFAPIQLTEGPAHTYYAASTQECAFLESVLHDVVLGRPAFFELKALDDYRLTRLRLIGPLQYVSFHSHDLPALGLTRGDLIDATPADSGWTRAWAEAALRQCADAAAIGYTSRRYDAGRCLMLVQQRLPEPPFQVLDDACIGTSRALRTALIDLASSLGIALY
ncbi:RES family NAD+ phosphorylase [Roseateles sp. MS654]|uniref:RES family NAD+ phosphorylase n=1 Tax=Roseateles sp. MS654 TaxID=3412685 RepID=UPI003C30E921